MNISNILQTKASPYEMFKSNLTKDNSSIITYDNFADILSISNKNTSNTENSIPSDNYTKYIKTTKGAPYSYLADDMGVITYNGITFNCDNENRVLCLGDMSEKDNILTIPLSGGGSLKVNRNNINDLAQAIDMFSPEDIKRILDALAIDSKSRKDKVEIDQDVTKAFMLFTGR